MKRAWVLGLLLLVAGFAGCLGDDGGDAGSEADTASTGGDAASQTPNGTAEGEDTDDPATLAEPPVWRSGDWWTVEVQDSNTGETHTITRVVAGQTGGAYRVGMPTDGFSHPAIVAHFPGFGNVDPGTLGFSVHGEAFEPLAFPLEEGKTWSTSLYQTDLDAEVTATDGTTAQVAMTPSDQEDADPMVELTYDAEQAAITELSGPLGAAMRVVDQGEDFEGEVEVPHGREQFIDGRIVVAFDVQLQPAPPTGTVSVPSSHEEASFAQIVGNVNLAPGQPGTYRETTTDPAGETTETQTTQVGGGLTTSYGSSADAGGEWSFEHVAGGVGAAATEIIAYQTQTAELPLDANDTSLGSR